MGLFSSVGSLLGIGPGMQAEVYDQSRKAYKAERKAAEVSRKIEARQRQREQMQQLRAAQIARATAIASAVNTGTADTSGFQGQAASIQAQTASNIAFSNQVQTGSEVIGMYQQKSADARQKAGNWAALAELTMKASQQFI